MGSALRGAVVATATIAAVVACRQLVGIGDAPPAGPGAADSGGAEGGADAAACGIAYAGQSCEACLESKCCAQATACSGSPPCSAAEECLAPCAGDPACRARCVQRHRVGTDPALPVFESCLIGACASECGLVCGGVGEVANPDAAAACQSCYLGQGCSTAVDCLSHPACAAYAVCTIEALTPNESYDCSRLLDDAGVDASAFSALSNSYCVSECEFGSHWSCIGHVTWPPGVSGDLTILLSLGNGLNQAPAAGVTAKVCNGVDTSCATPTATGVTGPDGTVSLVQQRDAGPVFTNNAYIDLSGGGIVPEVVFWSFPISESPMSLRAVTAKPQDVVALGQLIGFTQDPSNGMVYVQGFDCLQSKGVGLTYVLPGSSQIFYQRGGSFSAGLTETDSTGGAAFVNVPAGVALELTASATAAGGPIGQFSLFVRPGGFAQVWALPQPK